jgi:hypothetical protein
MLSTEQHRTQDTNEITKNEHTTAKITASFTARRKRPKLYYSTALQQVVCKMGQVLHMTLFFFFHAYLQTISHIQNTAFKSMALIPLISSVRVHRRSKCDSFMRKFQYYDPQLWVFSEHFSRTVRAHVIYNGLIRHQK